MKEWFTPKQLAEAGLPDVPTTERAVQMLAKRESWQVRTNTAGAPLARRRKGRGGGWQYHYTLLPMRAQLMLVARNKAEEAPATEPPKRGRTEIWDWYDRQSDKKKATARRRLKALEAVIALQRGGLQKNLAVHEVAKQYKAGKSAIWDWFDKVAGFPREDWLPHLCPRHAGRTRTVECDPKAWDFLRADYLRLSRPRFADCYERLERAAAEHGWTIPSPRTLERRLTSEIPEPVRVFLREGTDALRRKYPPQERDRSMFHALERVNVDGHKWDVFVRWPDGTVGRPIMVAIQDLYSNKILAWRIDRTENTDVVRLAFMDLFLFSGLPDHAYLDNGRAFASKYISGGTPNRYRFKVKAEEPVGVLTALGVDIHWTTPYSGQSKPIERAFRDLCNAVAKHPAFEGAYTGNAPDAKPENYGSKAVDLETFVAVVEQGIRAYNAKPNRRTRVCGGVKSFDQAFEESYARAPIRKATEEQLRMCMLAAENVRSDRDSGAVRLLGNRYWSEFLAHFSGKPLTVRFDPDNLHSGVHVYQLDGAYLGHAECVDLTGFADMEGGRQHQRDRQAFTRKMKELAELEKRMSLDDLVAALPDLEEPDAPETKIIRVVGNTAIAAQAEPETDDDEDPDEAFRQAFGNGLTLLEGGRDD